MRKSSLVKQLREFIQEEELDIKKFEEFKALMKQFDGKKITRRILKKLPTNTQYINTELCLYSVIKLSYKDKFYEITKGNTTYNEEKLDGLNSVYSIGSYERIRKATALLGDDEKIRELLEVYTNHEKLCKLIKKLSGTRVYIKNPVHYRIFNNIYKDFTEIVQGEINNITF